MVMNDAGNPVVRTEIVPREGAVQRVEFGMTESLTEYRCANHPSTMRGEINDDGATTIALGARAAYWFGLAPARIQGQRNPTLRLRRGRRYKLVWMNLDGVEHDFHLADVGGKDLAVTGSRKDVGGVQETRFEAVSAMDEYYCNFHRGSMRGPVSVV